MKRQDSSLQAKVNGVLERDYKSTPSDCKSTTSDYKSTPSDCKSTTSDYKPTPSGYKSKPFHAALTRKVR
jgi:hypothetical protein